MPWRATSVENTRYLFVLEVKERRRTFIDVCQAYGISPKTGYKWLARFEEQGPNGLLDHSRNPIHRPGDTEEEGRKLIIQMKLRHPCWGAKKLKPLLEREHPDMSWPSVTTFGNILRSEGLTSKRRRRSKLAQTSPLVEATEPNHTWSIDFKGWWTTGDGSQCEPLTVFDNFSRFVFCSQHVAQRGLKQVWPLLERAFKEYGMPRRIRSDNGAPFGGRSVGRLTRLAVKLIRLGITPEWIQPAKPQQNGRQERMHRTLKLEGATPPSRTLLEQQMRLNVCRHDYNLIRPHESLGMRTPADAHTLSPRNWTGEERAPKYPASDELRRVDNNGEVYWCGRRLFTSEIRYGEKLGFRWIEDDPFRA